MENLLAPNILGILIQTIGAIIVALITNRGLNKRRINEQSKNDKENIKKEPQHSLNKPIVQWFLTGVVAALAFSLVGFVFNNLQPTPTIGLTSPHSNEQINVKVRNEGGGLFQVKGTSERVVSDVKISVFVLIHPVEPFAEGWYIQPSVTMQPNGDWTGQAQIGDVENPPKDGDSLEIIAIVAERNQKRSGEHVTDPKDLKPMAQSTVMRVGVVVVPTP